MERPVATSCVGIGFPSVDAQALSGGGLACRSLAVSGDRLISVALGGVAVGQVDDALRPGAGLLSPRRSLYLAWVAAKSRPTRGGRGPRLIRLRLGQLGGSAATLRDGDCRTASAMINSRPCRWRVMYRSPVGRAQIAQFLEAGVAGDPATGQPEGAAQQWSAVAICIAIRYGFVGGQPGRPLAGRAASWIRRRGAVAVGQPGSGTHVPVEGRRADPRLFRGVRRSARRSDRQSLGLFSSIAAATRRCISARPAFSCDS